MKIALRFIVFSDSRSLFVAGLLGRRIQSALHDERSPHRSQALEPIHYFALRQYRKRHGVNQIQVKSLFFFFLS